MGELSCFYDLRFAGMHLRILAPRALCLPENLRSFLVGEPTDHRPDWVIEVIFGSDRVAYGDTDHVTRFPRKDGNGFLRVIPATDDRICRLFVPDDMADKFCINANWMLFLMMERLLLPYDRIILHASAVIYEGEAILFTAPSGIGKSTQADLWCRYRGAKQINGDRPILSKEENGWIAWGSPYAGSSRYHINECAPITAIMLLKQAPTCSVRRLSPMEAFRRVWAGMTVRSWDPSYVDAASLLTIDLITAVPVFEFCCTPDEQAVNFLEAELRKECSL